MPGKPRGPKLVGGMGNILLGPGSSLSFLGPRGPRGGPLFASKERPEAVASTPCGKLPSELSTAAGL